MRRLPIAVAASLLVAALLEQATAQTVTTSPTSGHPTQVVTVAGTAFADHEAVDVYVDLTDTLLLVTSATGTFSSPVTVPAGAQPGVHYITAIGRKSGDAAQYSFKVTTPWVEHGFGAAHQVSNTFENTINSANVAELGALSVSSAYTSGGTPAVSAGVAYLGAYPGVAAINTSTGATVWTSETGAYFYGSPALSGGNVYIGSASGVMYSLAAGNGTVHWSTALGGTIFSSPVIVNDILYFGCGAKVYALSAVTGAIVWTYTTGAFIDGSAAVEDGVVYIGSEDDNMYALNATTGALIWTYTTGNAVDSTPAYSDGVIYFGSDDGKVYAVKAAGPHAGQLLWSFGTGAGVFSSPAVADGVVYIGSADDNLYALSSHNGSVIWQLTTGSLVRSPAVANGVVYATSQDDTLYALDAGSGAILATAVTGANYFGSPVISDGVVYVASFLLPLHAFGLQAGTQVMRRPEPSDLHPNLDLVAVE
jgi:outer membrane protein assembly factor BamB